MRHSLASPLSWLCLGVCLGLIAACGAPEAEPGVDPALSPLGTATLADSTVPGWPTQGQMLHASSLESASFLGGSLDGHPLSNLHLEKGELVGEQSFYPPASAPGLQACTSVGYGPNRECGWSWLGVGTCTPQTRVRLGTGGGPGACSGDAMVRVCADAAPCEATKSLVSSDHVCVFPGPEISFSCPASGTYTVLTGSHRSADTSSVQLVAATGEFPGHRIVRGTDMLGAHLQGSSPLGTKPLDVTFAAITRAKDVMLDDGTPWRARDDTFLYELKITPVDGKQQPTGPAEGCAPPGNNPQDPRQRWAVPLSGVYKESTGELVTSDATRFTFGCNSGVIAKCYRWGYTPWLDGTSNPPGPTALTHWACTRMARADYCGSGQFHTQEGTHIAFWDQLSPQAHARPEAGVIPADMPFEAGWNTAGAVCLSHARWATMPPPSTNCPLVAPSYQSDGSQTNQCPPGQFNSLTGAPCATVCDTPDEALQYQQAANPLRLFNHSNLNGVVGTN